MNSMKILKLVAVAMLLSSGAAHAGNDKETHEVSVLKFKTGDSDPLVLRFEGADGLNNLADGESRTITSDSGEAVTMTRDGDQVNILTSSGQSFDVPFMQGGGAHEGHGQKRVKIMRHIDSEDGESHDTPTLFITSTELSDAQKTMIQEAAQQAGIEEEIKFIGTNGNTEIDINIEKEIVSETSN